ncbi:O-antigen ligase family protein [Clostridium folliculivorans]|uniref:Ligase n=1 Tax=Clostridium folliculivorans TaxID=2886038 RepID=A0A9W5XZV0_9CLOT|nr:O-antigen ligase family protein [Clostridium folliculivorans]GKU23944.1 ligase [Clostridium folliculivorans]GKU30059.1 ligase [Clostridium folliculivorans]
MKDLANILFCIYIFLIPLIPSEINGKNYSNLTQIVLFLTVILYIFQIIKTKKVYKIKQNIMEFITNKIYISLIIFLGIMVLSAIYASDKSLAIKESIRFFTYIVTMYLVSQCFDEREKERVIFTFIITTFVISVLGIIQYFTGIGADMHIYSSARPRIQATLDNPNTLGAFQVLMLFPLLSLMRVKQKNITLKIFIIITTVLCFSNIVISMSRSALIGLGVGLILLIFIFGKKILILIVPVGAVVLAMPSALSRIKQITDKTQNDSRIKIWNVAAKMMKDHPIGGVGNGNFITNYPKYVKMYPQFKEEGVDVFPSHNSYLKVGSELGVIGELSFIVILLLILREAFYFIKNKGESLNSYFIEGFVVVIIPFLVMNCFDNILFVPKVATYFWIMVAMLFSFRKKKSTF